MLCCENRSLCEDLSSQTALGPELTGRWAPCSGSYELCQGHVPTFAVIIDKRKCESLYEQQSLLE